jgi:hypothetical protein
MDRLQSQSQDLRVLKILKVKNLIVQRIMILIQRAFFIKEISIFQKVKEQEFI